MKLNLLLHLKRKVRKSSVSFMKGAHNFRIYEYPIYTLIIACIVYFFFREVKGTDK